MVKLRYIEYILGNLQDRRIVAQERPFEKYFLTDRIFEDPKFAASIFGRNATSKIFDMSALLRNLFVRIDDNNFEEEDYIDVYSLFAFPSNVGVLIIYAMLDAMNPDSVKHFEKGADKDQFVHDKIINTVIDPQRILWEFWARACLSASVAASCRSRSKGFQEASRRKCCRGFTKHCRWNCAECQSPFYRSSVYLAYVCHS